MWILLWPTGGRHPLIYALSCSDAESGIVEVVELWRVDLKPKQDPIPIILLILMRTKNAGECGFSCGSQGGGIPYLCAFPARMRKVELSKLLNCGGWT